MTSGSCEFDINKPVSQFIQHHLVDICQDNGIITLIFDSDEIPEEFSEIPGFVSKEGNKVIYVIITDEVRNKDTLSTVEGVKEILRKCDKVVKTPADYYHDLINCILKVGGIYSSYVELVLAHIFMVNKNEFWRYNQDKPISVKLSEKSIAVKISPLLGFLYQPNRISIGGIEEDHLLQEYPDDDSLSFHERIFLQKF